MLIGQEQRFAFPEKPQLFPTLRLIEIVPQLVRNGPRIAKGSNKGDGGSANPLPPHGNVLPAKRLVFFFPGERWIGGVEQDDIHSRVRKQARMFADYERIGGQI